MEVEIKQDNTKLLTTVKQGEQFYFKNILYMRVEIQEVVCGDDGCDSTGINVNAVVIGHSNKCGRLDYIDEDILVEPRKFKLVEI